ncbi:MAG TPA: carboxymuconolactone decarboxylase family protein [Burkholderiales bacterium]|nr:carboxymuconolactone decarboxylase family protein [Burkholderiales bacterium]
MAQRFPKLTPEQMTPAQQEVAAAITAGPRGEVRGPFIALLHNPELAGHVQRLGEHLRWKGKLPARLRELAVLVTARRWTCQHEWVMHSKLAQQGGLGAGMIEDIRNGREPKGMLDEEKWVYNFCRELHATGSASDETFAYVKAHFGLDGALELIALNGYYTLMAMVLNSAGLPLPGDVEPPLS